MTEPSPQARAWAASGAMALTGRPDGPALAAPDDVVDRIVALGTRLGIDPLPLLARRAAGSGLRRGGDSSAGGSARLIRAADEWVVVNLPRDDDLAAVDAWLEVDPGEADRWDVVAREVPLRPVGQLVSRAGMLGLPVAGVDEVRAPAADRSFPDLPLSATPFGPAPPVEGTVLVVDLSALWAGPLSSRLLADRGARVIKVESRERPDGARRGPADFFDALHHGKESVGVDLSPAGQPALTALLGSADVVVESSRPRALEQLGVRAAAMLSEAGGPRVWVSITGHGRGSDRVAFGDDAAAAGGLVARDADGPVFVADAVADPLAGVTAAAGVVAALSTDGAWLLDVSLASVAAHVAGGGGRVWPVDARLVTEAPAAPELTATAPELGADDESVARDLGIALG